MVKKTITSITPGSFSCTALLFCLRLRPAAILASVQKADVAQLVEQLIRNQ